MAAACVHKLLRSSGLRVLPLHGAATSKAVRLLGRCTHQARSHKTWYHSHCMDDPQPEGHMASHIGRRKFLATLGGAVAWSLAARGQQAAKIARIGYLALGPASARIGWVQGLRSGLSDLGYVEGRNIVIEFRWADGVDQLPQLAAELVQMDVDVIVAPSSTY